MKTNGLLKKLALSLAVVAATMNIYAMEPFGDDAMEPRGDEATDGLLSLTQEEKNEQLFDAIRRGDVDWARAMLIAGASANAHDNNGCSPLYCAAEKGNADLVLLLLKHKATVNEVVIVTYGLIHHEGWSMVDTKTSLHIAIIRGHIIVVQILLSAGADMTIKDKDGAVPLHYAVAFAAKALVKMLFDHAKMLLNQGVDSGVNIQDRLGLSPLHWAAQRDNAAGAQLLLEAGADANICSKYGIPTPIDLARQYNSENVIKVLEAWEQKKAASSSSVAPGSEGVNK